MKTGYIFSIAIYAFLLGCAVTKDQVKEIYDRQTILEAKLENLSKDVQDIKAMEEKREQQIAKIEKSIGRSYSKLHKRVTELEKPDKFPEIDILGNPNNESPDSLYSRADSYYGEGNYADAILEFQRFIDAYPQDKRIPNSYLKQGLSLINIGRTNEAKFFLETLIDKFPESEEAKEAKAKLKEISSKSK
jgi:TolA-binding protein